MNKFVTFWHGSFSHSFPLSVENKKKSSAMYQPLKSREEQNINQWIVKFFFYLLAWLLFPLLWMDDHPSFDPFLYDSTTRCTSWTPDIVSFQTLTTKLIAMNWLVFRSSKMTRIKMQALSWLMIYIFLRSHSCWLKEEVLLSPSLILTGLVFT